ncbi:MAG: hypothetical protein FJ386_07215 [Verrucomicrobia bacterium]|nr:hypothetical protein [Verrucomicrobiota bacterium]
MNTSPAYASPQKPRKPNPWRRWRVILRGPATFKLSDDGTRSVPTASSTDGVRDTTEGGRLKVTCKGRKIGHAVKMEKVVWRGGAALLYECYLKGAEAIVGLERDEDGTIIAAGVHAVGWGSGIYPQELKLVPDSKPAKVVRRRI